MKSVSPKDPQPGVELAASWGKAVAQGVRAARVLPGLGIRVDESPDGFMVSIKRGMTRSSSGGFMAGPWAVTFDGATNIATFVDCFFKRDSYTLIGKSPDAPAGTVYFSMPDPAGGTIIYLGFAYNSEDGAVEIISGDSILDVGESSVPESDTEIIRTPLYKVAYNGAWRVVASMMGMPSVGLYS